MADLTDDPTLAGARTQLSWGRTALGFALLLLAEFRWIDSGPGVILVLLGVLVVATMAAAVTRVRRDGRRPLLLTVIAVIATGALLMTHLLR